MLTPINFLKNQRIISIDAFRGITFLIMIIVNELAGVAGISPWLKHMPANADAMSFPDIVFPAFLFIVGMSIPFGINYRIAKGENRLNLNLHILLRALALIVMGFFMVNAEGGYHQDSMWLPIQLWALLSYVAFMLIWGVYQFKQPLLNRALVSLGILMLILLALSYRGGVDGTQNMAPQWWGILGLIGWAYLISCVIYQLCRGKQAFLLLAIGLCTLLYIATHQANIVTAAQTNSLLRYILSLDAHAAHSSIVLGGILCSLIFFEENPTLSQASRFFRAIAFTVALIIAATLLRPEFTISKIYATPSWCFYSAAICIGVFGFLYWLIDLKQVQNWMRVVKPAAINPLVCYLLPFVIEAILSLTGIRSPLRLFEGGLGMLAALLYAGLIMLAVHGLNKINFRLKF
jgi:heparan-alpha-glucosaminide N-acetyltransferase